MDAKELTFDQQEINVIDLLLNLVRQKRLIIGGTFAAALLTLALCFVVSPVFTATTTILPPQQSTTSAAGQLLGQLGGGASMLLGSSLSTTSGDLFVGLVLDDAVVDPVIDRFELMKLYDIDTKVETRKKVITEIVKAEKDSKSGIISISVDDMNAQRAADMANMFTDELKRVLETLTITEAGVRRIFFERELKKAFEQLSASELAMQGFQESTGAIKIDDQAAAVIQGVAALRAVITAKEVQLKVMKTYAARNNPDLRKSEEELEALQEQLRKQEEKQDVVTPNPLMSTGQFPTLGVEYLRRMRDFKYAEALYQLVKQQYEAARLDEAREATVVQVIQKAIPPDKKSQPKMVILVALSIVLGGGLSTLLALGRGIYEKASEHPGAESRFQELKRTFLRL